MPKEFPQFKTNAFSKLPDHNKATDESRPRTWLEREALKNGELSEFVQPIKIWYLNGESSWSREDSQGTLAPYQEVIQEHNNEVTGDERQMCVTALNRKEFEYTLTETFGYSRYNAIPDLVVLDRTGDHGDYSKSKEEAPLAYAYLQHYVEPIKKIRAAADTYFRHMLHNGLPDEIFAQNDAIDIALLEQVFLSSEFNPYLPITAETIHQHILYALTDDATYANLLPAVRRYIEDGDYSLVEQYVTDGLLERAITQVVARATEALEEDEEGEALQHTLSTEEKEAYLAEVQSLCATVDLAEVRPYVLASLQRGIETCKEKILLDEDWERWTARVLQPVIASVSANTSFQRHALLHGATAIPDNLSPQELQRLAMMTAKTKADWHSMAPERTRRLKRQFYEQHEAELEERAVHTADTEQELHMLRDILEPAQLTQDETLRILDIGSGTGRITIPLSEQYQLTGLDANQHFLDEAAKQAEGKNVTFKKGDIISYKNAVEPETYDAVTYTWHSILEAYGVGNTLETLTSAWLALRPGGTLIFDMPSRENIGMEGGWYEYQDETGPGYLAYLMNEEELRFTLKLAGFDQDSIAIREWTTTPTALYPEGMKK